MQQELVLDERSLTLDDLAAVAASEVQVSLGEYRRHRLEESRQNLLDLLAQGVPIYGTSTGVGGLSEVRLAPEDYPRLSRNIILSHACGVGEPLSVEVVRAILFAAAVNLSLGFSGVRVVLVERLLEFLNRGLAPVMPAQGSIGSLTHMASTGLVLMGEGKADYRGALFSGGEALAMAGLVPLELAEGEGLSLISGTPSIVGIGGLAVGRALQVARLADLAAACSFEALRGNPSAFDERVHAVRPHPGQVKVARNLRQLTAGSALLDTARLQDCLSLRTTPQVHGSSRQTIERAAQTFNIELNSATDNPLIFPGRALSACNAHGEPMAQCLDGVTAALSELGNISERRIDRMLNYHVSGMPPFLVTQSGLNSGLMMPQYVAAYLVAENKILSHPVSVDSIPMSAFQEDHVNMGTMSALMALRVVINVEKIFAIELLTAAQGLRFRVPLAPGVAAALASQKVWETVPPVDEDRALGEEIERLASVLSQRRWLDEVEAACGI
ncbi:MAG: histidine ammonia-lyase [Vulcanimicrobiota bacterium]